MGNEKILVSQVHFSLTVTQISVDVQVTTITDLKVDSPSAALSHAVSVTTTLVDSVNSVI